MSAYVRHGVLAVISVALVACGGAQARKERYLERGAEHWAGGNFEQARIAFRNALYIDPANLEVRLLAAEAAERAAKLREAADLYRGAIGEGKHQLRARARLGRLYALAGERDKALTVIEPGLAIAPADPDLLAVRGILRLRDGDEPGAYADAARAIEVEPTNESAVALLAALHRRSSQTSQAIALVERAVEAKPRSVDLRLILAQLFTSSGRAGDAQAQLVEVGKLEPGRVVAP